MRSKIMCIIALMRTVHAHDGLNDRCAHC